MGAPASRRAVTPTCGPHMEPQEGGGRDAEDEFPCRERPGCATAMEDVGPGSPGRPSPFREAFPFEQFQYDEAQGSKLMSEALQQEDEFLEYLMSLPVSHVDKRETALDVSSATAEGDECSLHAAPASKVGLDHLDNLCKLMEQLGELRDQNSKLQRRVQYLEDLKSLQEMHKRLQDSLEGKRRAMRAVGERRAHGTSGPRPAPSPGLPRQFVLEGAAGGRRRRERSRSVGHGGPGEEGGPPRVGPPRRSHVKSKVSKWTKVREAFRWEKARLEGPQRAGLCPEGSPRRPREDSKTSPVPGLPSPSPRGKEEGSTDDCPSSPYHDYSYQLSSSSSSEDMMEMDLHSAIYSEAAEQGPQRSASATDSTADKLLQHECSAHHRRRSLSPSQDEDAARRSKSLDCEDIQRALVADKSCSISKKSHRTPWGKVKDIIQTRKESVKRREEGPRRDTGADGGWEWVEGHGPPSPRARPHSPAAPPPLGASSPPRHEASVCAGRFSVPHIDARLEDRHKKEAPVQCHESGSLMLGAPPRPPSKWTKVKKAFLTSRKEGDGFLKPAADPQMSIPLSCSDYEEQLPTHGTSTSGGSSSVAARGKTCAQETPLGHANWTPSASFGDYGNLHAMQLVQSDLQKNYEERQARHKKLSEWERTKGGVCSGKDEGTSEVYFEDRRKIAEWAKDKSCRANSTVSTDDSHLPTDFRKRLLEWKKVRGAPSESRALNAMSRRVKDTGGHSCNHESLPPQFRKRLVEWQLWRAVTGKSEQNVEELHKILPEEFYRKLQEWERIKSVVPVEGGVPGRYADGALVMRKDASAIGRVVRRMRANEVALSEKWSRQRGELLRDSKQRGKEVQWLQKELQKVEREKMRLEREREKYLEREDRLERMRRAMGTCPPGKQEVLIRTSTGFFRFQGISEKFTRKLYEWEKQRGIGPEASTFTLLDPTYRPLSSTGRDTTDGLHPSACLPAEPSLTLPNILPYQQLVSLPRSRSEGSVAESNPASGGLVHSQSSSLSHIDSKEPSCLAEKEVPSRASSEPRMRSEVRGVMVTEDTEDEDEEETAALLVEVEDVEEETAAALEHLPKLPSQTPIYSYAPEEVTRLIDSSGSESEKDGKCSARVNRTSSVRTQSSYELIEENMTLINKLKMKEDICRELENEIEDLEEKIQGIAKTHREELERLRMEETGLQGRSKEQFVMTEDASTCLGGMLSPSQRDMVARLQLRVDELERCQEQLKQEEENLQVHSEQQAALAQNLVGKMKQLHEASKAVSEQEDWKQANEGIVREQSRGLMESNPPSIHTMALIQNLSTELLQLAEKLEVALADRNQEIRSLRHELQDRQKSIQSNYGSSKDVGAMSGSAQSSVSTERKSQPFHENPSIYSECRMKTFTKPMVPRQSSEELAELPFLLTNKVLELKKELSHLCISHEPRMTSLPREIPFRGKLQRTMNFQCHDEGSEEEAPNEGADSADPPTAPEQAEDGEGGRGSDHYSSVSSVFERNQGADQGAGSGDGDAPTAPQDADGGNLQLPLGPSRRKSFDCVSTPPSGGTRSPSVNSLEEWRSSVASWQERGREGGGRDSAEEDCDDTDSKSDDSESQGDVKGGREACLKTRRVSDTHVAYEAATKGPAAERRQLTAEGGAGDGGEVHAAVGATPAANSKFGEESSPDRSSLHVCVHSKVIATPRDPAPNIFVQTTRKIFSPVCGEPKGTAANVISYVVGFSAPAEEAEASSVGGKGVEAPWRKGKLPTPERAVPTTRPATIRRPLGVEQPREGTQGAQGTPPPPAAASTAHPLPPPSPLSNRRDKAKEAAPSIRLMIAKYDRRSQEAASGRSPEVGTGTSGGRSPAWLSPTEDRRELFAAGGVKAQMEKYQEEVRKALLGFSNRDVPAVQKSASAGIIRSFGVGPCLKPPLHSIAKSSSAGAIKTANQPKEVKRPAPVEQQNVSSLSSSPEEVKPEGEKKERQGSTSPIHESIERTLQMLRERHSSPPPSPSRSQKFAHMRALRLRKAKEEFMTRNVAGEERSVSSRFPSLSSVGTGSSSSPKAGDRRGSEDESSRGLKSVSSVGKEEEEHGEGEKEQAKTDVRSRHSQISFGSESSYDDTMLIQEGLSKSASSGMIDFYSHKCSQPPLDKVVEKDGGSNASTSSDAAFKGPSTRKEAQGGQASSKMGILSRFRKVKMRTKKMGAISALCRQSLLVNVDKEDEGTDMGVSRETEGDSSQHKGKSVANYSVPSCRSCPSSPVPSSKKPEGSGCWTHNPKHIF